MIIIKRVKAKEFKLLRYFTGRPCKNGHISERYVSTCQCVDCALTSKQLKNKICAVRTNNVDNWVGVSYTEAFNSDLLFYDGKVCIKCNNSKRYTNNCSCVACSLDISISKKRKEYVKQYNAIAENKLKNKARMQKYISNIGKEVISVKSRGYYTGFALYTSYKDKLTLEESPIEGTDGILEVKCAYCSKYFKPLQMHVRKRIQCLNNEYIGESRLYCSGKCKHNCSIFGQQKYDKHNKPYINKRPLQLGWKKLYIESKRLDSIDGKVYCEKCGAPEECGLIAHHIDPVVNNPIESADIDNCLLLCYTCDKEVHNIPGCTFNELRCD
jgi:hypothetical protein